MDGVQASEIQQTLENAGLEPNLVVKPVKALIKTAIEAGEEVSGARQDTKVNLKIS